MLNAPVIGWVLASFAVANAQVAVFGPVIVTLAKSVAGVANPN